MFSAGWGELAAKLSAVSHQLSASITTAASQLSIRMTRRAKKQHVVCVSVRLARCLLVLYNGTSFSSPIKGHISLANVR